MSPCIGLDPMVILEPVPPVTDHYVGIGLTLGVQTNPSQGAMRVTEVTYCLREAKPLITVASIQYEKGKVDTKKSCCVC